jgi:hypothetical protein
MGFMDKVKAQATVLADKAQTGVQQGQTKIQEMQSGKQADHLLRELGAYVFLSERGRTQPESEVKVAGIMGQLDTFEAFRSRWQRGDHHSRSVCGAGWWCCSPGRCTVAPTT